MAVKLQESKSNSTSTKFNDYLNISIRVSKDTWIKLPLNCALPDDTKGLSKNQIKLIEKLKNMLDNSDNPEDLTLSVPISGTLYRRKDEETDESDWDL